jgi:hypothetical protein
MAVDDFGRRILIPPTDHSGRFQCVPIPLAADWVLRRLSMPYYSVFRTLLVAGRHGGDLGWRSWSVS